MCPNHFKKERGPAKAEVRNIHSTIKYYTPDASHEEGAEFFESVDDPRYFLLNLNGSHFGDQVSFNQIDHTVMIQNKFWEILLDI